MLIGFGQVQTSIRRLIRNTPALDVAGVWPVVRIEISTDSPQVEARKETARQLRGRLVAGVSTAIARNAATSRSFQGDTVIGMATEVSSSSLPLFQNIAYRT